MDRKKGRNYEDYLNTNPLLEILLLFGVALPCIFYLRVLIFLRKTFALWPIGINEDNRILLRRLKDAHKEFLEIYNIKVDDDNDRVSKARSKSSELEELCIKRGIAEWRVAAIVSEF